MEKEILTKLVEQNMSTYQMAQTLNCSQTNIRYWLRKHKLSTCTSNNTQCTVCSTLLSGGQRKYCSNQCKSKGNYKNSNGFAYQSERAKQRKQYLIDSRGGGCEICGYNKCLAAIDFHHNQNIKNFNLDSRKLSNTSMKRILEEFKYCQVLCANCHREIHHN